MTMKRLLLASVAVMCAMGSATAADMPVKAPPPVAVFSWSGCYLGGNLGFGSGRQDQTRIDQIGVGPAPVTEGSETDVTFVGGGQVGCDYQFAGGFVLGARGQFDWGDINGSHALTLIPGFTMFDRTRNIYTATGRVGWAINNNMLFYGQGGGAWARNSDALFGPGPPPFLSESATWTASGWTIGFGAEIAVWSGWSVFGEFNYMDFGTKTNQFNAAPGLVPVGEHIQIRQTVTTFLVGANWRFNWFGGGPVAARY
jgi:outer membrane immunogenic protein